MAATDENISVTKVCRDRSPRLLVTKKKRVMARNGIRYRKINRMEIQDTAHCRIVEVDSPNQLFAKFDTDVTTNLQYKCPHLLTRYYVPRPEGETRITDYVMAPLEEDVYARARILKEKPDESQPGSFYCLVVFIDYGSCQWVHTDTFVVMDESLYYQPWQAFAFSLFGVSPGRRQDVLANAKKPKRVWTQEHKKVLSEIIGRYEKFIIKAVVSLKDHVKEECFPYHLFAIDEGRQIDIALQFALECRRAGLEVDIDRSSRLFSDHQEYRTKYYIEPKFDEKLIPSWRQKISSIWGEVIPANSQGPSADASLLAKHAYLDAVNRKFDVEFEPSAERPTPLIKTFNDALFQREFVENNYMTPFILISTDKMSINEFYVMPLKRRIRQKHGDSGADAVEEAKKELRNFCNALDAFYVESCNRHAVDPKITCEALLAGKEQYAVYEVPHNADSGDGRYRRVMLVGLRLISEDHCDPNSWMVQVVYMDFGGFEWVPLTCLLRIHSRHCLQEPFVVQVYAHLPGVDPHRTSARYADCLTTILKASVPVHSVILGRFHHHPCKHGKIESAVPHCRPNVMILDHFKVEDSTTYLEDTIQTLFTAVLREGRLNEDRTVRVIIEKKGGVIRLRNVRQEPRYRIDYEYPSDDEKSNEKADVLEYFHKKAEETRTSDELANLSLQ
uniref:Tudor domain-containing protein n=2 Tax=Steinernema glaseri TaxID=37863 RepID=A0A1I7Y669_9BILA